MMVQCLKVFTPLDVFPFYCFYTCIYIGLYKTKDLQKKKELEKTKQKDFYKVMLIYQKCTNKRLYQ